MTGYNFFVNFAKLILHCDFFMKRTLYITDLDGTLLNEHSRVSERSSAILSDLVTRHNVLFSIATARTPATAVELMSCVPTPIPLIVMAGAAMWDTERSQYVNSVPIPENVVQRVCAAYEAHGVHPFVYRNHGGVLHTYHHPEVHGEEKQFIDDRISTPYKRFIITSEPYTASSDPTLLIFAMNRFELLEAVQRDIVAAHIPCHSVCYHDIFNHQNGILEVYAHGVTKAAAVTRLKALTGADRLVVFGDNLNDREMMQAADHSVAVENAFDEVKAIADEVIEPNVTDSVARWIAADVERNR